ncbi:DUF2877 domain-containing protein [Fredinandcohnia salidurans]|uniref:DUF2877 domain-containing protein n=1 Tax=Fredinandcohnia salidurans TaxID=2595041 RepID=A0ABW4MTW4_9BACI
MEFAVSGDGDFIQRIKRSELHGYVHSTFKRTINIKCHDNNEIYTIACCEMDNGPNTLIINLSSFDKTDIEVKDKVRVNDNKLCIANKLAISTEKSKIWECVLPEFPNELSRVKRNVTRAKEYIEIFGKSGGMKRDQLTKNAFVIETHKMLEESSHLLIKELLNLNMTKALQHARGLIGLGPGLTPSGDDFLVGLLTIFNLRNCPFNHLHDFSEEIVKIARPLTNEISFFTIKKASRGKVRENMIRLVQSLLYGEEDELIQSLNKVLSIGSSSGTDIAYGLISGLEHNILAGGKL